MTWFRRPTSDFLGVFEYFPFPPAFHIFLHKSSCPQSEIKLKTSPPSPASREKDTHPSSIAGGQDDLASSCLSFLI